MDERHRETLQRLQDQLGSVILGKPEVLENLVIALLSGGHVLMEDVPGTGKTTLAKVPAKLLSADFKRVQFTPDLHARPLNSVGPWIWIDFNLILVKYLTCTYNGAARNNVFQFSRP